MGSDGLGGPYGPSENERVIYVKPSNKEWKDEFAKYVCDNYDFLGRAQDPDRWDELEEMYIAAKKSNQNNEVLKYCRPHTDQMWAANIVSIILNCDFRDAKQKLDEYFNIKE